jgi:predicted lactoylglutathione lyase
MMFVALKVRDMKKSIKWYTDILGMQQMPYPKVNKHETQIQVTCIYVCVPVLVLYSVSMYDSTVLAVYTYSLKYGMQHTC